MTSRQPDNRTSGSFKVVSVTPNVNNGTVTQTMTNNNGEVIIRIGDRQPAQPVIQSNGVYDISQPVLPVQNNGVYEVDAHHVIYTKHSTATIYKNDPNSSTQAVKTRHITKIRENGNTHNEKTNVEADIKNNNFSFDRQPPILFKTAPKDACFYCKKTVYQKEKIGPIKDVLFHKQCFHCAVCNFTLTLNSFHQNPNDTEDRRLYCKSHHPVPEQSKGSINDKQIKDFINKPKLEPVNVNIRGGPEAGKMHSIGPDSLHIKGAMDVPRLNMYNQTVRVDQPAQKGTHIDHTAVGIKTAMNAPRLDNYNQTVRPVPPLSQTPVVELATHDPDHYKTRQVQTQISVPTPPMSPQQVRFSTEYQTHVYNGY